MYGVSQTCLVAETRMLHLPKCRTRATPSSAQPQSVKGASPMPLLLHASHSNQTLNPKPQTFKPRPRTEPPKPESQTHRPQAQSREETTPKPRTPQQARKKSSGSNGPIRGIGMKSNLGALHALKGTSKLYQGFARCRSRFLGGL